MMKQKAPFSEMISTAEAKPWGFMLIGGVAAGKTTLLRALESKSTQFITKTQMIDYAGWGIDTPGEFIESGFMRRNLVSSALDARLLIAVQDVTRKDSVFPPHYFLMFPQHTIGVVTKVDNKEADVEHAQAQLTAAGVTGEIFCVSALTGHGISELRAYLLNENI